MKRRILIMIGTALAALLIARATIHPAPHAAPLSPAPTSIISAAGRVEAVSEEVKIGSELPGKLRQVLVDEGDHVHRGQVIAILNNDDYAARIQSERAEIEMREAELRRVVNGSRHQERSEAQAAVREADAVMANARAEMDRRQSLFRSGDISRSDFERSEREFNVAKARYDAAVQRHSFIDADARDEDRARAQGALDLARAQLQEAQALLAKTVIRAPMDGVILRRHLRAGETVDVKPDSPVFTMADDSVLRVRVDVDETDVARIAVGQPAWFTADAFRDRKFLGHVVRVGEELGRKRVRTDEPTERVDTKILETLVQLDGHPPLPVGLRVDSYIDTKGATQ
ncbi:MAG TPA: efflux RND transporter periplasmic adaptor subunit [Bryobacteraceae bacterium]|jgi:ABC exporter DevB family membrane fusion protein